MFFLLFWSCLWTDYFNKCIQYPEWFALLLFINLCEYMQGSSYRSNSCLYLRTTFMFHQLCIMLHDADRQRDGWMDGWMVSSGQKEILIRALFPQWVSSSQQNLPVNNPCIENAINMLYGTFLTPRTGGYSCIPSTEKFRIGLLYRRNWSDLSKYGYCSWICILTLLGGSHRNCPFSSDCLRQSLDNLPLGKHMYSFKLQFSYRSKYWNCFNTEQL